MSAYPPQHRERIHALVGLVNSMHAAIPLNVVTRMGPLKARMLTGDEIPGPVPYDVEEKRPVYLRHPFAVYELSEGRFSVTRNGEWWGDPFETTDRELAVIVCDRWAQEFPEPDPGPNAEARADIHRIASELRFLSRRG